jgi:hypothetical protein
MNNGYEPRNEGHNESHEEWYEQTNHRDSGFVRNQRQRPTQEYQPDPSWDDDHSNSEEKHSSLSEAVFPPGVNQYTIAHSHRPTRYTENPGGAQLIGRSIRHLPFAMALLLT